MSKLLFSVSISVDGFMAGPNQSMENPLGVGGMRLHEWVFVLAPWRKMHGLEGGEVNASSPMVEEMFANVGAVIMGRNMFGGGPGPWGANPWRGWWGENPPYHMPVYVVTHHPREPLVMQGGTTFDFVTDGPAAALTQARATAGDKNVLIAGGASIIRQYLSAGLVDEMTLSIAPVFLGSGKRPLDQLDPSLDLERIRVIEAPGVTHLTYRVSRTQPG